MSSSASNAQFVAMIKNRCMFCRTGILPVSDFCSIQMETGWKPVRTLQLIFSAILYLNIRFFIQRTASKS